MSLLSPIFQLFAASCQNTFLGMRPWYYYLDDSRFDDKCNIRHFTFLPTSSTNGGDIPLVLLAIIDDLLRIAAIVAIAFVIVGAVQMITSQGNPEDTARAQSTIINALVGLAIAVVATAFVAFIGSQLGN